MTCNPAWIATNPEVSRVTRLGNRFRADAKLNKSVTIYRRKNPAHTHNYKLETSTHKLDGSLCLLYFVSIEKR